MTKNITYYIGAGASFHSLPLVKSMKIRMRAFSRFLKILNENKEIKNEFAQDFIQYLDEIIEKDEDNTSIDSYAKQLFFSKNFEKLNILKCILSSYLSFEQLKKPKGYVFYSDRLITQNSYEELNSEFQKSISNTIDKRYRNFWSEILDTESMGLPRNVFIISWNYDMQFETSYCEIMNENIKNAQEKLNVCPPKFLNDGSISSSIIKLNGTAGLLKSNNQLLNYFDFNKHNLLENVDYLIEILEKNITRTFLEPQFYFSWEENEITKNARWMAKNVIDISNILVVIGYSFPIYNKKIDAEIFKNNTIEKVYLQCPENEADEISVRITAISGISSENIKPISNLETFYIPNELS